MKKIAIIKPSDAIKSIALSNSPEKINNPFKNNSPEQKSKNGTKIGALKIKSK